MKLIDILNMISKGELREDTQIKYDNEIYKYDGEYYLLREGDFCLLEDIYLNNLNDECELIEPQMAPEKIKELDNYDWQESDYEYQIEIICNKLNEVIRRINNVR